MKKEIKNNLKSIRLAKGLTQKQVAEYLHLQCEDRISHWEKGSSYPSIPNIL